MVCVCVCTRTQTHTATLHKGFLDMSPGVWGWGIPETCDPQEAKWTKAFHTCTLPAYMSYIWDLKNKTSYYIYIKIKLHIYVLLALKSHLWHVLNYRYVDLYFSDVSVNKVFVCIDIRQQDEMWTKNFFDFTISFLPFSRVNMMPTTRWRLCASLRYATIPILLCDHALLFPQKYYNNVSASKVFFLYRLTVFVLLPCQKLPYTSAWFTAPSPPSDSVRVCFQGVSLLFICCHVCWMFILS